MSIFNNISFLSEGEQADAYKARKAKEEEDKRKAEEERVDRRAGYITADAKIKGGKLVDVDPYRRKNGIHKGYQYGDYEKTINAERSGSTNTNVATHNNVENRYWTRDERDGRTEHINTLETRSPSKDDKTRDKYAQKVAKRTAKPGLFPDVDKQRETDVVRDSVNKHMRRHPDKWKKDKQVHENSIFESVQFI